MYTKDTPSDQDRRRVVIGQAQTRSLLLHYSTPDETCKWHKAFPGVPPRLALRSVVALYAVEYLCYAQ